MRRYELAFLIVASCNGDDASAPPRGSSSGPGSGDAASGGVDSSSGGVQDGGGDGSQNPDASVKPLGPPRVYTGSGDGKIRVFTFDTASATIATPAIQTVDSGNNPSFLAIDPEHKFLYAVDE